MAARDMALLVRWRAQITAALLLALAGLPLTMSAADAQGHPPPADEYRLKAAFIYGIVKFIDWPAAAFADSGSPLTVCVLGADPFGSALDDALRGKSVAGRSLATRRLMNVEPGCHVLFVSASEVKRLPVVVDQLRSQSVLLMGEDGSFLDRGGMIRLAIRGDRVRFAIHPQAVEQARLKASARLLQLAEPWTAAGGTP